MMHLLHNAVFGAEVFDVKTLLECEQDQVNYACKFVYDK